MGFDEFSKREKQLRTGTVLFVLNCVTIVLNARKRKRKKRTSSTFHVLIYRSPFG